MSACGLTVGHKCPFKTRERPIVSNIHKATNLIHARHNRLGGVGNLFQIITKDLDTNRQCAAWPLRLFGNAEIGTGET